MGSNSSNWNRKWGKIRAMMGNSMGGLRGGSNLASWLVAGTLAYFLWVKPSQDLNRQQQERAALAAAAAASDRYTNSKPQGNAVTYGNKDKTTKDTDDS